jgi:hypothetical protein
VAWFKIDDHLYSHPKWMALPKPARALWVTAGSWCAGQLLDGFVPHKALPLLDGTRAEARKLVDAGLWEETPDGYLFHDWAEYQPVRRAVMEKRAKDAERLRKWREQRDAERGE